MRRSLHIGLGVADSEFISSVRDRENLRVRIRAWNAKVVDITFDEAISVYDRTPGGFSDFVEIGEPSDFLRQALVWNYDKIPESHPYKEYAFLNVSDLASLKVIARGFHVRILDSEPEAIAVPSSSSS